MYVERIICERVMYRMHKTCKIAKSQFSMQVTRKIIRSVLCVYMRLAIIIEICILPGHTFISRENNSSKIAEKKNVL